MQYLGGKSRIARPIADTLLSLRGGRRSYIEPFLGGASVAALVVASFDRALLSDAVPDVALLWEAAIAGHEFPSTLSRDEWDALRHDPEPSALRAFAGFGVSFGGKWFAGYAKPSPKGYDYAAGAARSIAKKARGMQGAEVCQADYREVLALADADTAVYLDPPYAGTTEYGAARGFDSGEMWEHARAAVARGSLVLVSEYNAPPEWEPVWTGRPSATLAGGTNGTVSEHLFAYRRPGDAA